MNFHNAMYNCATCLLSKKANLNIFREMLRYATTTQKMDSYSHVLPTMQDAANAMEIALS